ncbi:porin [Verminephrobacter aporrectodeae subsp. tuberculatae]|uniref:Porin n=1 Tax=Verminephrobacter aporrectodeae subsp. tuberculatae TaxID=1110392 RepID=A0ABT3KT42_9BURK|nr:porin [Verminephrobacter aporrectodeae]MCW5321489.1 porin [Verminephrobacter aporrectodeae subsp. tuberculatae]MCW8197939.1 porin [Verminephrobacter aporrectodeae subsp. tuberculatae]
MKKSLIALAALAASGAAMAQSSVTLFGVADATFAYGTGTVSKKTQLASGGLDGSRLGFRGVEDLGGGMSASFHLEAGLNNDDGTGGTTDTNNQGKAASGGLIFNRRSTLSLNGGFGEVRLGRDYTPHFKNLTAFDPFGTSGVGTTQTLKSSIGGPTTIRASNSIGYLLPGNLGGFYGQGQFYMGENDSNVANKKDGNGVSLRAGYANGPIDVAGAFAKTTYLLNTANGTGGNITTMNFGGKYDLGMVKILGQYSQDKVIGTGTGKGLLGGVQIPVGPAGEVRLSFSTYKVVTVGVNTPDPATNKIAAGYVHNLSKRTAVYGTFANVTNKKGAEQALNNSKTAPNKKSSGFDFGIRHSF